MNAQEQTIEVWGEFACFTRPELKVERFSYPVMTPSAARGIFEAIYAKPKEFRWQVTSIEVLAMPSYIALRRNEVKEKISVTGVSRCIRERAAPQPIFADGDRALLGSDEKGRTQRQTMALKNVRYRLRGVIIPWPGYETALAGMEAQFQRRVQKGKCFCQPFFGCREFPAYFEPVANGAGLAPVALDLDLGLVLYDVFDLSRPGTATSSPQVSLFHCVVQRGVIRVPRYEDAAVLKTPEGTRS